MEGKTKIKILLIFGFFLTVDLISNTQLPLIARIGELNKQIEKKDYQLSEYAKMEEKYKQSISSIVENTARIDSFLNVGGEENTSAYDTQDYVKLLSQSSDFDSYLQDVRNFYDNREKYYNDIPNIWPLEKSNLNRITSGFGARFSPYRSFKEVREHTGIDLASSWKANVLATADGVVTDNWIYNPVYGKYIVIKHDNGFETCYGHLAKSFVREGDHVKRGQIIGLLGNTGISTGPHLHYEIKKNGKSVDPINYLRGYEK